MSLVPAFEIGVWNAWIFMLFIFLYIILTVQIFKSNVGEKIAHGEEEKKFSKYVALLFFVLLIYSVFLPLKLGMIWFYIGLPITLVGLLGSIVIMVNWAVTPAGEPVTRGFYRCSRHPIYVTGVIMLLGVSIISASWVFFLFTIIFGVGVTRPYFIKIEEAQCLGHYGAAYREYMNRTSRWLGLPKEKVKQIN